MTLSVREADDRDLPALIDAWAEAWTALLPDIDFDARRPWFLQYLGTLRREGAILLVAFDAADRVQGFVTVDPGKQDVDQLVTALSAQRRGVGRRLLRLAKERSPVGLSLTVNTMNTRAIGLYLSEGFAIVGNGVSSRSGLPVNHMRWRGFAGTAPA